MKTVGMIYSAVAGVALVGSVALAAEVIEKQTTTTTTYDGTVSDISPVNSTIVLKSESSPAPMTYRYTKTTSWVDSSGSVITSEQVRNSPVTVHYVKEGDSMVVTKVVASKPSVTTTYDGTVSEISPVNSTIVIKSESSPAPMTYKFNKTTTWVDSSGSVITSEQVRNSPVTVHYVKEGDSMVVTKVVASKPSILKETTTTTTTETK